MQPIVIEYIFEGHKRGYNVTSPTRGIDEASLRTIWRQAMPRGQGWGAARYAGARSIKCFPLDNGRIALAETVVTDQRDENGRGGIRRAEIAVLTHDECYAALKARLASYPDSVHARIERKPTLHQWKRIVDEALPKLRRDAQIILTTSYSAALWQAVEAFVLKVATSRMPVLRRAGQVVPFTTLALDYHDELPLVALPAQQLSPTDDVSTVVLAL